MAEEAKKIRTSAKARFTRKWNEFLKSIKDNKSIDTVKRTFAELNKSGIQLKVSMTFIQYTLQRKKLNKVNHGSLIFKNCTVRQQTYKFTT